MTIRCTHRVGLLLTGLLLVTLALPFVTYAPNRTLREGRGLWRRCRLAGVQLAAALPGCCCWLPGRIVPFLHLLLAELLFPLLIWGSGGRELSAMARRWRAPRPAAACGCRWRFVCCWPARPSVILPSGRSGAGCSMRKSGCCRSSCSLSGRSISSPLKEYANRQEVFDDALRQHLLLLFGTLLPGLLIGLPLGVWLWRRPRWQAPAFTALNVIQTIPSVALFGLLIAPLAGLARYFPTLGELGVSGTGVAPALIALTLYALLPLVRGW